MRKAILTLLMPGLAVPASATVINIPADYSTIQQGIDASFTHDTVLVQPGTYYENINFNGHNIVLGSLFLITSNENYIDSTIIDGNDSGTVVTITGIEHSATIAGFTITNGDNYNNSPGGGITCDSSNCVIRNNIVEFNSGNTGGIRLFLSDVIVSNNKIFNNFGQVGGLAILYSNVLVVSNIINYNEGTINSLCGFGGLGISCSWGFDEVIIANNIISHNTAPNGAGIGVCEGFPLIIGNTIAYNTTNYTWGNGGGIIVESMHADANIINNTIVYNYANYEGGGVYAYEAAVYIINSIIRDNQAQGYSQLFYNWGGSITYNNIQGGHSGTGNIDVDPLFRDPDNEDFHLMSTVCGDGADSPCIDTGDPDIFDDILSCDWGLGSIASDMGAYGGNVYLEICSYVIGDANGDNLANGLDVIYLVEYLKGGSAPHGTCECPPHGILMTAADVNASCSVNGLDVTYMVSYYKGGPDLMPCDDCPPEIPGISSSPLEKWKALLK